MIHQVSCMFTDTQITKSVAYYLYLRYIFVFTDRHRFVHAARRHQRPEQCSGGQHERQLTEPEPKSVSQLQSTESILR